MRWFDATPAGRILNRFSEDFTKVDGSLVCRDSILLLLLAQFIVPSP